MAAAPSIKYEFGPFRIDPERRSVLCHGEPVAITPKVFAVLLTLVRRSHEVVPKDELLQAVWPGRVVEESNLSQCIFVLRKILGDAHGQHHYIVTFRGEGYRFAGNVLALESHGEEQECAGATPSGLESGDSSAIDPSLRQAPAGSDGAPVAAPPAPPRAITRIRARAWPLPVAGVLLLLAAVAAAALLIQARFAHHQVTTPTPASAAPFDPPSGSLVVLPFENLSGDPNQRYLTDGITEELTNTLGGNPGLRVIAWQTASTLRGSRKTAAAIGKELNVANILSGSIERSGDAMRVTVELVDTRSGVLLWSHHYDDTFANIFKVQDDVSAAIAGALQVRFADTDLPQGVTPSPAAHDLMLRGRALENRRDAASLEAARDYFERAAAADPGYAEAHAMLSRTLLMLTQRSDVSLRDTLPRVRAEAERAVALDPRSADAWIALGNAESSADPPQNAQAMRAYKQALALDPSNADAHVDYGDLLPVGPGLAQFLQAVQIDPGNANAWNDVALSYRDDHDWMREITAIEHVIGLNPEVVDSAFDLAYVHQQLRQYDATTKAFDLVKPANAIDRQQVQTGRLVYGSLRTPELRPQALAAVQELARHQANLDVAGNLLYMYVALGKTEPAFELLSHICPADPDDCVDLKSNPLFAPLQGDPRFQALMEKYATGTAE